MKKILLSLVLIIFLCLSFVFFLIQRYTKSTEINNAVGISKTSMKLTSLVFQNNGYIPLKYSCDGENVNPPLTINDVPAETKSLVLIVEDPDAPSGTFIHWIVYNIDPTTTEIAENSVPTGAQEGSTSFGNAKYGGPCPPSGIHHYQFKLYALNNKFEGLYHPDKSELEHLMQIHLIAQTELVGLYTR